MRKSIYLLLLLTLTIFLNYNKLQFVILIARHGARNPIYKDYNITNESFIFDG